MYRTQKTYIAYAFCDSNPTCSIIICEECSLTLQPFWRLQWTLLGNPPCTTPHFFEQTTLGKLGNAPQRTDREHVPTNGQQLCV